jgi:hypothetical protein
MTNEEILTNFEKQQDGSWLCLAETTIVTTSGPITIAPGSRTTFGDRPSGFDLAEYLEQLGVQFGS